MRNITLNKIIKIMFFMLFACGFFFLTKVDASAGELNMYALNIGHGDAFIFESQNQYMVVDAGTDTEEHRETILSFFRDKLNIPNNRIQYVVATHADHDHIGGMKTIFEEFDIERCIYSEPTKTTNAFNSFVEAMQNEEGLIYDNATEGDEWQLGDATVKVIYDGRKGTTYNESSIILKITCDGKSVLMMGDIPTTMEDLLMSKGYDFKADILKIGHHGAAASSAARFLDVVKPTHAVISSGDYEETGLPKPTVLQKLARRFIKTYVTQGQNIAINIKDGFISTDSKENKDFISITRGSIVLDSPYYYAPDKVGQGVVPKFKVYADGAVVPSNHYTVKLSKNTYSGIATLKVTGTNEKYLGSLSTTFRVLPRTSKILTIARIKTKLYLHWNQQMACDRYQMVYATDKKFTKNVRWLNVYGGQYNKKIITQLNKKKKYYLKVRAIKNNIGYGRWSSVVKK